MDWSTLRFSGIPITTTGEAQTQSAFINSTHAYQAADFQTWKPNTLTLGVPQTATGTSTADSSQLSSSFTTLSSTGDVRGGVGADRELYFTAMDTGKLTVSIDYSLQETGRSSCQAVSYHSIQQRSLPPCPPGEGTFLNYSIKVNCRIRQEVINNLVPSVSPNRSTGERV